MPALASPDPPLTAGGVLLRPWHERDAGALLSAFCDPDVLRHSWGSTEPYGPEHAAAFLREQEAARLRGEQLQLAVTTPTGGRLLGGASLYDVDAGRGTAAVGYWLVAGARGRGVATTAVRQLAGHAFAVLGLQRLELTCGPDNDASRRVAERAGFTYEGRLRAHLPFRGGRRDSLLHSLLPGEPRRADG